MCAEVEKISEHIYSTALATDDMYLIIPIVQDDVITCSAQDVRLQAAGSGAIGPKI
jgi:hypothetical protein